MLDTTSTGTHFSAGDLPNSFRVFLYIFLAAASGVTGADEFGVVLEAGRDGLTTMRVALHELDHLGFLFVISPFLECVEIGEDEGVAVIGIARAIGRS